MGFQCVKQPRTVWNRSDGSLSIEAASGIAALTVVAAMFATVMGAATWHVKTHALLAEALRIATAAGDADDNIVAAKDFIKSHTSDIRVSSYSDDEGVTLRAVRAWSIPFLSFRPQSIVEVSGVWFESYETHDW